MEFSGVTWLKSVRVIVASCELLRRPLSLHVPQYFFPCALNLTARLDELDPPDAGGVVVVDGGGAELLGADPGMH